MRVLGPYPLTPCSLKYQIKSERVFYPGTQSLYNVARLITIKVRRDAVLDDMIWQLQTVSSFGRKLSWMKDRGYWIYLIWIWDIWDMGYIGLDIFDMEYMGYGIYDILGKWNMGSGIIGI